MPALPASAPDPGAPLLVLTAMAEEAAPLRERLQGEAPVPLPFRGGASATRGLLAGQDTVVVTTGIGIAAAAAAACWAILETAPRAVLAAGTCGGLAADVVVGTVVVGSSFVYSLADGTAFGYVPGQVPGSPAAFPADPELGRLALAAAERLAAPVREGLVLSGDAFVTSALAPGMRERFPHAVAVDMESTATARTAAELGVPFTSLRCVSDLCGPAAGQQFHLELAVAAQRSAEAVEELAGSL